MSTWRFLFTVRRLQPLMPRSSHSSARAAADTNFLSPFWCMSVVDGMRHQDTQIRLRRCITQEHVIPSQDSARYTRHENACMRIYLLLQERIACLQGKSVLSYFSAGYILIYIYTKTNSHIPRIHGKHIRQIYHVSCCRLPHLRFGQKWSLRATCALHGIQIIHPTAHTFLCMYRHDMHAI